MDHLDQRFRLHQLCAAVGLANAPCATCSGIRGHGPDPTSGACACIVRIVAQDRHPDGMSVKYAGPRQRVPGTGAVQRQYRALFGELPSQTLQT